MTNFMMTGQTDVSLFWGFSFHF